MVWVMGKRERKGIDMDMLTNKELGAVTVAAGKVMILCDVSFNEVFQENYWYYFIKCAVDEGCPEEKAIQAFDEGKEEAEDGY